MRLVALFALACVACVAQSSAQPATPAPAYATTASPGGVACPPGGTCNWTCDQGNCAYACQAGANVECDGGNCRLDCMDGATCNAECDGGNCATQCGSGTTCNLDCDGGHCQASCAANASCELWRAERALPERMELLDVRVLVDGELELHLVERCAADPERRLVPAYHFEMRVASVRVGGRSACASAPGRTSSAMQVTSGMATSQRIAAAATPRVRAGWCSTSRVDTA